LAKATTANPLQAWAQPHILLIGTKTGRMVLPPNHSAPPGGWGVWYPTSGVATRGRDTPQGQRCEAVAGIHLPPHHPQEGWAWVWSHICTHRVPLEGGMPAGTQIWSMLCNSMEEHSSSFLRVGLCETVAGQDAWNTLSFPGLPDGGSRRWAGVHPFARRQWLHLAL